MESFGFTPVYSLGTADSLDYSSSVDSDSDDDSFDNNENVDEECSILFLFYEELVEHLISHFKESPEHVRTCLKFLTHNYKNTVNGQNPNELDFNDLSMCLGYLHRYAVCHTTMVRNAVSDVFDLHPADILRKLNLKRLDVVFLGSGPGNDFVGFLSALYGHHDKLFELNVTAVDRHVGWEKVFDETIRSLREGTFGNTSKIFEDINVISNYVEADLTDSSHWSEQMRSSLEKADLVFFVKVLSHIPDGRKFTTLQNIVDCMQDGALLIFIDCPLPSYQFLLLDKHLSLVYGLERKQFTLKHTKTKFGLANINKCSAYVRVFKKTNSVAGTILS